MSEINQNFDLDNPPIHGKSYAGKYYFRVRHAEAGERTMIGRYNHLTIDIAMLTAEKQPRLSLATPVASLSTLQRDDAKVITAKEWNKVIKEVSNKLLTNE